jgi:hypothetical protein
MNTSRYPSQHQIWHWRQWFDIPTIMHISWSKQDIHVTFIFWDSNNKRYNNSNNSVRFKNEYFLKLKNHIHLQGYINANKIITVVYSATIYHNDQNSGCSFQKKISIFKVFFSCFLFVFCNFNLTKIMLDFKNSLSWDITPCSSVTVNQHFRGICHLHLKCQSVPCCPLHAGFLLGLLPDPRDGHNSRRQKSS